MTAHQSTGVAVIKRTTQDGYDWPNPNPAPVEVLPVRCPRCHLPQAECDAQRAFPDPEPLF